MKRKPNQGRIKWPTEVRLIYGIRNDPDKDLVKRTDDTRKKLPDGHYERTDSRGMRHQKYLDSIRQRDRSYDPDLEWWH